MRLRAHRTDLIVGAALGLVMAVVAHRLSAGLPPLIYEFDSDTWFEGDLRRVMLAITDPEGREATHRSDVHPLFILLVNPPLAVLRVIGWGQLHVARVGVGAMAGVWLITLFVALRTIGLRRPDAVAFAALGAVSSAAAFWLTVPETYALASASMVAAIGVAGLARRGPVPEWASALASAGSLSITTTNWMAGLAATVASHRLRRAVLVTVGALAVVLLAWGVQRLIYPDVDFFIGNVEQGSGRQVLSPRTGGPLNILKVTFLFSEVAPEIETTRKGFLSVQAVPLAAYRPLGAVAAAGWVVLMALGFWSLFKSPVVRPVRIALGLTLAGQTALALLYGTETFLYALNFAGLLVALAALAATTAARLPAVALAVAVAACAGVNNHGLRADAIGRARELVPREYQRTVEKREKRRQREQRAAGARTAYPNPPNAPQYPS